MKKLILSLLVVCVAAAVTDCARNPVTGRREIVLVSESQEIAMGHEIGHVTARHSVQQITRSQLAQIGLGVGSVLSPTFGQFGNLAESSLGVLFLRYSRDNEREADRLGVEYAARAA